MEAAQAVVAGTTMIDHITEMAIVTAMDKTAAVAEAVVEAAGRPLTVNVTTTAGIDVATTVTLSTATILVGKNLRETAETVEDTKVVVVDATTVAGIAKTVVMGHRRRTGPFRCLGTIESRRNCFRAGMGLRASTLTAMRTFRWKRRALTCPMVSKTFTKSS